MEKMVLVALRFSHSSLGDPLLVPVEFACTAVARIFSFGVNLSAVDNAVLWLAGFVQAPASSGSAPNVTLFPLSLPMSFRRFFSLDDFGLFPQRCSAVFFPFPLELIGTLGLKCFRFFPFLHPHLLKT